MMPSRSSLKIRLRRCICRFLTKLLCFYLSINPRRKIEPLSNAWWQRCYRLCRERFMCSLDRINDL